MLDLDSLLVRLIGKLFESLAAALGLSSTEPSKDRDYRTGSTALDDRLRTIAEARKSLEAAMTAVVDLEVMAIHNKADVEMALVHLADAQGRRAEAQRELEDVRRIIESDVDAFRRMAGVPSKGEVTRDRFRERALGFIIGVLASVFASLVWWSITQIVPLLRS